MASNWFPVGTDNGKGWRLDIVSLLAVIGESSMEAHSQALTSSWTCILPRIIPAPQALLKPSRPTRMPQLPSQVVGVHNGTAVPTLSYFPNIIHPIDEQPPLSFVVFKITHKVKGPVNPPPSSANTNPLKKESASTSIDRGDLGDLENGPTPKRRSTFKKLEHTFSTKPTFSTTPRPHIPTRTYSPLSVLSVVSCLLTVGLLIWAFLIPDGTAVLALGTISLASSIVGYASWWSPLLTKRIFKAIVPPGDVVIRTREGAFILVKCNEDVARELYTGTEECNYKVSTQVYRFLVGLGTFLLMVSVVLLGNCNFTMQAAIGVSYIVLNGAFWLISLLNKGKFWDLSAYLVENITPLDAKNADKDSTDTFEGKPSFTRTMWYAIRETKRIDWVKKSGAAPTTPQWDKWLNLAEQEARKDNRKWNAVEQREKIVGQLDSVSRDDAVLVDNAEQHVPALQVDLPATR
ncbi:hypothetical protein LHYA1_G001870 [Lachnellula hyalina]|uniref:Uncharacterized protein n=1 Tax=Lachnellula hyalina TaxID=1316788 RepID=A0A8H8R7H2_9HELO|nr:uncharacterized protein LHYA1_G001870 [Lachnellula hyalina]TVY29432.1 hypothetical protein LHYA1_G001870 [Lachnellula hyalina]